MVIISWYVISARAWWAHQWFDTLLYWKLIIQKYFSIFKIDKNAFQLKNKLTDMRAFFSYFTWREKKVMQHYFWNWLTHNFCHTLERWGRYYRMGSFKIFAEVVRFFGNQSVFYASLFHSAIKEIYIDYWNFKNKFANWKILWWFSFSQRVPFDKVMEVINLQVSC